MADENRPNLDPADFLSVRSRVSWGAIFAGAMVALSIYILLTLMGLALGLEAAARGGADQDIGIGAAIYVLVSLLISFFFGGWTSSRLAVGESKLEAVIYGVVLWGILFLGIFWLVGTGVRAGFTGVVGAATGAYGQAEGGVDINRLSDDLKRARVPDEEIAKIRDYYQDPAGALVNVRDVERGDVIAVSRSAAWWSLVGVVISMAAVILGALIGSGELPIPVPILGVKRPAVAVKR
ncbi:hypothetical protein BH23PLA1_BH23PLA1_35770 [soil metagenome]